MQQQDLNRVRASVLQQCGSKVKIQLDRGRNKVDIQEGSYCLLVTLTLLQEIFA